MSGNYRDTVLLGRKPPIAQALLNAEVTVRGLTHIEISRAFEVFSGDLLMVLAIHAGTLAGENHVGGGCRDFFFVV